MAFDVIKDLEARSSEALGRFKREIAGIRGGRPSSKLVENIAVDYLGSRLLIKQMGSISVVPPREIQISVWDKEAASLMARAIEVALNVQAMAENNVVRVHLPPLSEERRLELIKLARKEAEEARIKIRALRDETIKKIKEKKESGEITEDDHFDLKEEVQKSIDKLNEEIEEALENKIKEIQQ